jgi:ATP-dependent Lhr-like helicase
MQRMSERATGRRRTGKPKPAIGALEGFLAPVREWFAESLGVPSPAQELAWPAIRRGESTLLLAPTGSGKTLAAFLCAIDGLLREGLEAGGLPEGIQVLYITPLKALGNDIQRNLLGPLAEITARAGGELPELRVAVRTGDTPQSERQRMARKPPHILITTPESLYLLLGSKSMADALARIRTVIVDEVHALCDNKRGVHLAVSLERLEERVGSPLQRIGCSATLRPLEEIAAYLVGYDASGAERPCTILDAGMRKQLDLRVMAPLPDFLEASREAMWSSAYARLLGEIAAHRTTLVFTNSRYKAERTSLRLAELAPPDLTIGVHHGSMSREARFEAETALKAGDLRALVATSSLELGIDIGSVDLVYQLESPKSVAAGLQRVGRAGHLLDATSKGRILIFDRDELLEAAAVCRGMAVGDIDRTRIPRGCLDVLAQQVAGAVASGADQAEPLLAMLRRSHPYRELSEPAFEQVLAMLSGDYPFQAARPPRPLLSWDRASGRLTPTRGASQVTAMCVGTIPESGEYEIVIEGTAKRVGKVQSEFADESLRVGDVFALGSSAWRVVGFQRDRIAVREAAGATPTVPWWTGPIAPRSPEVGRRVGELRQEVASRLADPDLLPWLEREYLLGPEAARAIADYIREQAHVAPVPTHGRLLVEQWRDELGRDNVVLHCPLGERLNRTWGVVAVEAARQRGDEGWWVTATNDLVVLTHAEGETGAVPTDARSLLLGAAPESVDGLAETAARGAVGIGSAFRDAAVCALQVLRTWQGRRVPLWLRNHYAQELFGVSGSCAEYPITAEALREHLTESLDPAALGEMLRTVAEGDTQVEFVTVECPSPFAQSLLAQELRQGDARMARDRRAQLLRLHREVLRQVLSEEQMADLLDPKAIARLEARLGRRTEERRVRDRDELAQLLHDLGELPARMSAVQEVCAVPAAPLLAELVGEGRVVAARVPGCEEEPERLVPSDLWRLYHDAYQDHGRRSSPLTVHVPVIEEGEVAGFEAAPASERIPRRWLKATVREDSQYEVVERYLRSRGPVTEYEVMNHTGWAIGTVEGILDRLVTEGKAARGVYTREKPIPQWVDRANLEEIHRLTLRTLQRELEACAPYEVMDFLTRWQHVHPEHHLLGEEGLREVLGQVQGIEAIQGAWETEILPGRVAGYRPEMLDRLIASGEVCWRRVGTKRLTRGPITFCLRRDMEWLAGGSPVAFDAEREADCDIAEGIPAVREYFREHGSAFFDQLLQDTGVPEGAATRAVWHLAWCGELTCDTYECLRHADFTCSLSACYSLDSLPGDIVSGREPAEGPLKRLRMHRMYPRLGRWLATERLTPPRSPLTPDEIARRWAGQLLRRWGVVTRNVLKAEHSAPTWARVLPELKRLELLGEVRRGYFIASHQGEQYALPEAVELLRECRARRGEGTELGWLEGEPPFVLTSRDPANLYVSSLDVLDGRGKAFYTGQRSGNLIRRCVLQAGQALIYYETQLVTLTREQLAACIDQLKRDASGREVELIFRQWNETPIEKSPVAALLRERGFGLDGKGWMMWPPKRLTGPATPRPCAELFPACYDDGRPVEYGLEYTLSRTPEAGRPLAERVLSTLVRLAEAEGYSFIWGPRWPEGRAGRAAFRVYLREHHARICLGTARFQCDDGQTREFGWLRDFGAPEEVDEAFEQEMTEALRSAREFAERYARKPGRARGARAALAEEKGEDA